jgi:hypothetical protein
MRRFFAPDKRNRVAVSAAGKKMWVECGVGMSVANDQATRNHRRRKAAQHIQACYAPLRHFIYIFLMVCILPLL